MKLQRFPAGVKPLEADLNAINENTEDAFGTFFNIFSGDPVGVLFESLLPVTSLDGTDLTVTTPQQYVGINGSVDQVAAYQEIFDVDGVDLKLEIFFVMSRVPVTATRNFMSIDPQTTVAFLQNLEAEIATITSVKTVYLWSNDLAGADQVPVTGPDDLGYVKLATVLYDQVTTSVVEETAPQFRLPASVSVPISNHGSSHLPGGTDELPVAALTTSLISGSSAGLMPEGSLYINRNAIQDLVPVANSPFLTFATAGTNTVIDDEFDPKLIQVGLRTDDSLTITSVQGAASLGVRFNPKNASAGNSDFAARADHIHALSESGLVVVNLTQGVTSLNSGTLITKTISAADLPEGVTLAQILNIKYYFEVPNLNVAGGFGNRKLEAPWCVASIAGSGIGTLGVRTNITGASSFQMEIGSVGILYLTPAAEAEVQSWTSPQYGAGQYPKQGTLHIVVTALRTGANG